MLGKDSASMARSYRIVGHLLNSGVDLLEGLNVLRPTAVSDDLKKIMHIRSRIQRGLTLTATLRQLRYPSLDVALIELGEETGTLPSTLKFLGDTYEQRAQLEQTMVSAAFLPTLLVTFSILVKRVPPLINGTVTGSQYLRQTAFSLWIFSSLVGGLYLLIKHPERYPRVSQALLRAGEKVPRVRVFLREMAMYRFFSGLYVCIRSGYEIKGTFSLAGSMTSDNAVRRAARTIPRMIDQNGLAGAISAYQAQQSHSGLELFTNEQISQILVGEESGRLEQCLGEITKEFKNRIEARVGYFKEWAPRILYGLCMVYVLLT